MGADDPFVDWVLEQLEPLGGVRARRMFGGWGIYRGARMIALIADDRLFLKVDAATRDRFAGAGSTPFVYVGKGGRTVTMTYWELPAEALDDPDATLAWARLALEAALRRPAGRASRRRRST